jgi:MscS family membrane protein
MRKQSQSTRPTALGCATAVLLLLTLLLAGTAAAQHPLAPPDRTSPQATLTEFLAVMDALGRAAVAYQAAPGPETDAAIMRLAERARTFLDLSQVPQAQRAEVGLDAAILLWEVLSRIPLPPAAEIPDRATMQARLQAGEPPRYTLPDTEITLVRVAGSEDEGLYLFSPGTVRQLGEFYRRVAPLPYLRPMPLAHPRRLQVLWGGWWLMPPQRADGLPAWLQADWGGQAVWKWLAVFIVLALALGLVWGVYRLVSRESQRYSLGRYLRRLAAPATFLALRPLLTYVLHTQIAITGRAGQLILVLVPALIFLAIAWVVWLVPLFLVEVIIRSPRIPDQGLDASLLRLVARAVGLGGVLTVLFWGGNQLGLPLYGVLAGVGISGLAIALAAQGTLENFLGSLNLFGDRPVRVGDFCRYGTDLGTVEEIGLRSTRIRGLDRTVTAIPNADLSKMQITNFARRDRMLLRATLGLRYETAPEQLRHVLAKLRELLLAHPKVTPDPARVRFVGFGAASLDLEVFAYVATRDYDEFLAIREDLYLRMLDLVAASGTRFAFSSQTLYLTRDPGLDPERAAAAVAEVQRWRDEQALPFPDFGPEAVQQVRDTLAWPPPGSSAARDGRRGGSNHPRS